MAVESIVNENINIHTYICVYACNTVSLTKQVFFDVIVPIFVANVFECNVFNNWFGRNIPLKYFVADSNEILF